MAPSPDLWRMSPAVLTSRFSSWASLVKNDSVLGLG